VRLLARALIAPSRHVDALEYYPFSSIQPVAILRRPRSCAACLAIIRFGSNLYSPSPELTTCEGMYLFTSPTCAPVSWPK